MERRFKKITFIQVENLAGQNSFYYDLSEDRNIDILTGKNGLGKTSIFSIINALFNNETFDEAIHIMYELSITQFYIGISYFDEMDKCSQYLNKDENSQKLSTDNVIFRFRPHSRSNNVDYCVSPESFSSNLISQLDFKKFSEDKKDFFNADCTIISANRIVRESDRKAYGELLKTIANSLGIKYEKGNIFYDALNTLPSYSKWANETGFAGFNCQKIRNVRNDGLEEFIDVLLYLCEIVIHEFQGKGELTSQLVLEQAKSLIDEFSIVLNVSNKDLFAGVEAFDDYCYFIKRAQEEISNEDFVIRINDLINQEFEEYQSFNWFMNPNGRMARIHYELIQLGYIFSSIIKIDNSFSYVTSDVGYRLIARQKNNTLEIRVIKKQKPNKDPEALETFSLNNLSSGEKNLISLFLEISSSTIKRDKNKNSIILVDEPENSLHIAWQERIVDAINMMIGREEARFDCIIATHSPSILENNYNLGIVPVDVLPYKKDNSKAWEKKIK